MPEISLTEEGFFKRQCGSHSLPDMRRYRIEYGFECGCPEGVVYLPMDQDPSVIEGYLTGMFEASRMKKVRNDRTP